MNELKSLSVDELLNKLVDCGMEVDKWGIDHKKFYKSEIKKIKKEIMRRFYAGEPMK